MAGTDLLAEADVVVVGAGVIGASIAYQLNRKTGKRIIVVDQAAPLGGMSGRTFGQVRLHYSNALMLQLALRGYDYFRHWQSYVGYGDPGYVPMGYMLIVVANQLDALKRNVQLAQDLGIDTRFVDPGEIKTLEPAINTEGLEGGAWDPEGGYIDVTRIVLSWLSAIQEGGVRLLTNTRVSAIETRNGTVTGVAIDQGRIHAPIVISATGSWGKELLADLDIDLPLDVRRLETMYLRQPPGSIQIGCCITDGNSNIAIRPHMGREILCGAYPSQMPLATHPAEEGDQQADDEHLERIRKSLSERLPDFADAQPVRSVSGTYDITPDWHPVVGWAPGVEGLFVATGFSGHGLKLAPAIGEAVAAMVDGKETEFDMRPLRFERFAEEDLMYLAYGPGARA